MSNIKNSTQALVASIQVSAHTAPINLNPKLVINPSKMPLADKEAIYYDIEMTIPNSSGHRNHILIKQVYELTTIAGNIWNCETGWKEREGEDRYQKFLSDFNEGKLELSHRPDLLSLDDPIVDPQDKHEYELERETTIAEAAFGKLCGEPLKSLEELTVDPAFEPPVDLSKAQKHTDKVLQEGIPNQPQVLMELINEMQAVLNKLSKIVIP